jgi:hypothetical protein
MPNGHSSDGENVSEIQALTNRVQELSDSVDFWNLVMLWGLFFGALAAAWIGISTRLVVVRAKQQTIAQGLLDNAKDRQLQIELKGKDRLIAAAGQDAAHANERAGKAVEGTAKAQAQAAEANEKAESERLARVKIEASVAWRRLTDKQKINIAKRLHEYPTEAISVWFLAGDAEGQRFASDIAEALREGKMNVYPPRPLASPGPQTASVTDPITPYETGVQVMSTNEPPSRSLAGAIERELRGVGFDAKIVESDAPDAMAKNIGLPNVIVGVVGRPDGPQGEYKLQSEREAMAKNRQ